MPPNPVPRNRTPAYPIQIQNELVRAKLLELLGLETIPEEVDLTVDSEKTTAGGITLIHLHFSNIIGETVPGILLIPTKADTGSLPGVPEKFKVRRPEINHLFLPQFFEWMVEWFGMYL